MCVRSLDPLHFTEGFFNIMVLEFFAMIVNDEFED
jgi:hypothetical protein